MAGFVNKAEYKIGDPQRGKEAPNLENYKHFCYSQLKYIHYTNTINVNRAMTLHKLTEL